MSSSGTPAMCDFVRSCVRALPKLEAEVLLLRDVERWNAAEVCETLKVSDVVQRALLQSARERVRQALEDYPARN
jgi:DNA-directed RNA polymerase specialized sigma24 family protein